MRRLGPALLFGVVVLSGCIPPRPSPPPTPAPPSPTPTRAPTAVTAEVALRDLGPDTNAGVPVQEVAATAADIAGEGSIAPFVSALAVASAFGPPPTETLPDYVVVTVARLKPGLFGDVFFRGWRDTFDAAVCEQAGGVAGHAEAEIGGRQTFIGTCAGGVHTYHVYLPDQDVIVSLQGAGDGRFGERVIEGLTG